MIKLNIDYKNKQPKQINIDTHSRDAQRAFNIYNELLSKLPYYSSEDELDEDELSYVNLINDEDFCLKRLDDFLKNFVESNTGKTKTFKLNNLDFNIIEKYGYKDFEWSEQLRSGRIRYHHECLEKDEVKNIDMFIKPEDKFVFLNDLTKPQTYGRFISYDKYEDYIQAKCIQEEKENYKKWMNDTECSIEEREKIKEYLNTDLNNHEWKLVEKRIQNIIDKYSDDLEIIENNSWNFKLEEKPIDFSKTNKRVMKM